MPFALLIIGIALIISAVRDTQGDLLVLVANDFIGPNNFWYWVAALLMVGAVGFVDRLKPLSDGLLVIILLGLLLASGDPGKAGGGFFKRFVDALGTTTKTGAKTPTLVSVKIE